MNLSSILNTVIAMVVVLLILSLIVQAIQTFIKKLLKLKSRQIVDSLEDLYEQAISGGGTAQPAAGASITTAQGFSKKILDEFRKIGRETKFGRPILDSLSKGDLLKIITKLESENLVPDYVVKFQALCNDLIGLKTAMDALAGNANLIGAASAKFAEMRGVLAPIFNDVQCILDGNSNVRAKVLFGDLIRLGKINPGAALQLIDDAQQAITHEMEVAGKSNPPGPVASLQALSGELAKIAGMIGGLSQKADAALAPLRIKLEQVETWYDTVMQGFDERYTRHMKNVAVYISIVIVILLNANFFKVYHSLATNEVLTSQIVQKGPEILDASRKANEQTSQQPAANNTARTPNGTQAATPTPTPATNGTSTAASSSTATPTPSPAPVDIKKEAEDLKRNVTTYVNTYESFGFEPLSPGQVEDFVRGNGVWEPVSFKDRFKKGVEVLFGWTIMVLLLSVGAPFWQDTLESLFGVKNLLRQKSNTQNIETESGAGQPKQ
ncbi:MAG: hypothetical protein WBP93_16320 [Pyrinomonadaceae bacterium]